MTREEAIKGLKNVSTMFTGYKPNEEMFAMAIKALEQEPCEDAISREDAITALRADPSFICSGDKLNAIRIVEGMPPVTPKEKIGHCKDCKYFKYDLVVEVDGTPLIAGHKICSRWAGGCKTKEDGYCFLFEPQESEE